MTKKRRGQHRPPTPSYREQEMSTRGHRSRRGMRVCPLCGSHLAVDDRSRTERMTANSDHPLVAYLAFHDHAGENSSTPGESDRFLAWLDGTRTIRAEKRLEARAMATEFERQFPVLAGLVVAIGGQGRSGRDVAAETYGAQVRDEDGARLEAAAERGRIVLREKADRLGLFAPTP
jgi:hypothetical protein